MPSIPRKGCMWISICQSLAQEEYKTVCLQSSRMKDKCPVPKRHRVSTVSSSSSHKPVLENGPRAGPEAMGKGEGRFWSQGTVLCDAAVNTVTASDMGWQTLLHCSYSLLPLFSTTPINHTTWYSLVESEPLPMLIQD